MPTVAEALAQAKGLHSAGQHAAAADLYQRILQVDAGNGEAMHLLASAYHSLGHVREAEACFLQAARLLPDEPQVHDQLGVVLLELSRFNEAAEAFQRAISVDPKYLPAYGNLGNVFRYQGRLDEAAGCYRHVLALNSKSPLAHNDLGLIADAQARFDDAVNHFRRATSLWPDFAEAHANLGTTLARQNRLDEAVASYRRAAELRPEADEVHLNLGAALANQGQYTLAVESCRRALELKPDLAAAHYNLAVALKPLGHLDEAAAHYRRAIELDPNHAAACNNLGGVLREQNRLDEAVAWCQRALVIRPNFVDALSNLAAALADLNRVDEAIACIRRSTELEPDRAATWSNLAILSSRQGRIADVQEGFRRALAAEPDNDLWRLSLASVCPIVFQSNAEIARFRGELAAELETFERKGIDCELEKLVTSECRPSFNLQFQGDDLRPVREAYARLFSPRFPAETARPGTGKPRIGFMVVDRHEGLFIKSMAGVLEGIDPSLFELVLIGSSRGVADMSAMIRGPAISTLALPSKFEQMAETIRRAQLDVLYYWEVGNESSNYFLPFHRLAPVQCTSWGIQVTSGVPRLDYYLSSKLTEPADAQAHYTERLLLADTLLTFQRRVSAPAVLKPRAAFGCTVDQHLYVCAQQLGKFHPDFDLILAGILRRDPLGVILGVEDRNGTTSAGELRRRFAATVPDVAERIVLLPFQPGDDYLSLIAAADVMFDPLHFGGVNSTYDGLALDKPIVTLPSPFQRGRYTLACYQKMGVLDCVAANPEQYIDLAVALGTDAKWRGEVVDKIRRASPVLFEDDQAVRERERLFSELVAVARGQQAALER